MSKSEEVTRRRYTEKLNEIRELDVDVHSRLAIIQAYYWTGEPVYWRLRETDDGWNESVWQNMFDSLSFCWHLCDYTTDPDQFSPEIEIDWQAEHADLAETLRLVVEDNRSLNKELGEVLNERHRLKEERDAAVVDKQNWRKLCQQVEEQSSRKLAAFKGARDSEISRLKQQLVGYEELKESLETIREHMEGYHA